MDWPELVRMIGKEHGFTHLPDEAVESVLWEHTSYPLGGKQEVERQIREFFIEVEL